MRTHRLSDRCSIFVDNTRIPWQGEEDVTVSAKRQAASRFSPVQPVELPPPLRVQGCVRILGLDGHDR